MTVVDTLVARTVLDTSGFSQGAAQASGIIDALAAKVSSTVVSYGAPIAAAFAASKALAAFGSSDLPGAKAFHSTMKASGKAVQHLSEVVGEFLAPAAAYAAKMVTRIATALEPMIRTVTAFKESATDFLMVLGSNFLGAFANLMPTAKAAVDYLTGLFTGPVADWKAKMEAFRSWWNSTWDSILTYMAPILVGAGKFVDSVFTAIKDIAVEAFGYIETAATEAGTGMVGWGAALQEGLVTVLAGATTAIENWRLSFDILKASGTVAIEFLKANFETLGGNAVTIFANVATQLMPIFSALGQNITEVLTFAFGETLRIWENQFAQWRGKKGRGLLEFVGLQSGKTQAEMDALGGSGLESGEWMVGGGKGGFNAFGDMSDASLEAQFPTKRRKNIPGMNMQAIPSFDPSGLTAGTEAFKSTPAMDAAMKSLDSLATEFKGKMADKKTEINSEVGTFIAAVKKGLTTVTADVKPRVAEVSNKTVGSFEMGSKEAYSAIVAATSGVSDKQLAEAKKHTKLLGDIAGGSKPKKGKL
jgi:hypothetical protein